MYTFNAKTEFFLGKEAIFLSLRDTLTAEFKLDPASIRPAKHIFDDLQLDSLDLIELITSLKDHTNGEIDPSVYRDSKTVQDLVDLLQPFWKVVKI
jgi:acyl carrier protein